jgi:hypothetical protein
MSGLAGGLNLYGFANGDPVNFSEPFGLQPQDDPCEGAANAFECTGRMLTPIAGPLEIASSALLMFAPGGLA